MRDIFSNAPAFDRLNYYYGQLLGAADFLTEQRYFRDKLRLHNRCLHGYGIVCGLGVVVPPPAAPPATAAELQIDPGLALDSDGNELVVRTPIAIADVLALLSPADRASLPTTGNGVSVWLRLCYQERGIEPNRPVLPDACAASPTCLYGKTREQVCVTATLTAPTADARCTTCCGDPAADPCLVLARIDSVLSTTTAIVDTAIHTEVRRVLGTDGTTITGVSWTHGGRYVAADAISLLGVGANAVGLTFQFSGPVYTGETAPQGTVDAWLVAASGAITSVAGTLTWTAASPPAPAGTATSVTFRAAAAPTLGSGDRILVTLRAPVLLDACCRPLAGANVGGRVPVLPTGIPDTSVLFTAGCTAPPGGGAWATARGGNFDSWFFVR